MSDFDPLNLQTEGAPDEPQLYDQIPNAAAAAAASEGLSLDTIMRIPVTVKIVLGSASMPVAALMKLGRGALIPLDRKLGEPVDVIVNGRVVARGEVVVMDDDPSRLGISLTEVVGPSGAETLA
ncbi:flagellar motor switch protein FliN [Hyphomicrobium sulfonivorans]|uniref:Flagellar motor switch protein FliN n=1 Tax=Hyphomicrobium sulfonivorans TaxID=121290 RepID=A0A109BEN7_HYPSL|nr:flagellar motor switch protein FliN [Hyphomicrobium sulfonivorans]KWT67443.1 Flagellar motor switch protein FliN [Hyphomicrobium sulfonivorans]MBI1648759.1 flagellar motor switch protein FliN [Hyphomicrobium sulfonivorans]NSL70706.1 flagellar motor switch protein FliN [Hyphomicrobium sulfonivorans]